MKYTKEFLFTTAVVFSLFFLAFTHSEVNATENEIQPATAISYNKEIAPDNSVKDIGFIVSGSGSLNVTGSTVSFE